MTNKKFLYRYEAEHSGDEWDNSLQLVLRVFPVIKETPKGFWITKEDDRFKSCSRFFAKENLKWVSGGVVLRKFACETKEEAMKKFCDRRRKTISVLQWRADLSSEVLKKAEKHLENKEFPEDRYS